MNLHTLSYLPASSQEMVDPTLGLSDLRKGLNTILMGYLMSLGAVMALGGVAAYLFIKARGGPLPREAAEHASTVIFAVVLFSGLIGLWSLTLIVRGKWMCLVSAPEVKHAKWMMFMSILCVLAAPALNSCAFFIDESKADARGHKSNRASALLGEFDGFKNGVKDLDTPSLVKLTGKAIGLLSGVFFVLFLRAVALGWGADGRARFAELYLFFMALLSAGLVVLLWKPSYMLSHPLLLLGLAGGWVIAGVWYFTLILSMIAGISKILAHRS
jgi:hypothetical protein